MEDGKLVGRLALNLLLKIKTPGVHCLMALSDFEQTPYCQGSTVATRGEPYFGGKSKKSKKRKSKRRK